MMRACLASPFGPMTLVEEGGMLTSVEWQGGASDRSEVLTAAIHQLTEYFAGRRQGFDVPLDMGSGFQARFLRALIDIPFGETRTYGELALALEVSAQAIGQACGANPLPVLIPCHRVLSATGLGGFSAPGGVETKVALLRLEGAASLPI